MDIRLAQALQGSDIVGDVLLPLRYAHLYGIVDIHALNSHHLQALGFHLLLHLKNPLHGPCFPCRDVIQGCDHTLYTGNLADLLQCNRVHTLPKPTQCHIHSLCPPYPYAKSATLNILIYYSWAQTLSIRIHHSYCHYFIDHYFIEVFRNNIPQRSTALPPDYGPGPCPLQPGSSP